MEAALAAVYQTALFLSQTFGTSLISTYAVVKFVAITAATMAANKLLAPKMPGFSDASLADRTQMVRSPIAARQIVYGESKVSGVLVYISTTGTKNEYLHLVIALAGHEVEAIGDVYFNDELALTGAGSAATGRFAGYAEIYKKLGSDTQTVETNLEAATSGLTNGKWTSAHRLRGIAYIYVRLVWNDQVWAGGIPNVSAMVQGKKVYDPRTTTTAYSANAALCLRDYLTDSTYGLALTTSEIDDTAFTAAANICDEQVQILPASPTTYENRYEANGVLYTSASPDENIGKLLSSMGGLIAYSGGRVIPYAAGYRIPTVTLTDTDFAGAISVQTKTSSRDRVNAVKGVFVSEKSEWQPTDFPPQTSTTYYAQDNSIRYWRDVVLPMTTSSSAAQRLARIELQRARQEVTFTARFRLDAMQVRAGDTVMVTLSKFGWSAKVFEVLEWHFVADGSPPQLAVEMTLRETASSVYDWNVSDEIEVDTTPTTTLPNPFTLDAPTNLTLTADGTTQLIQADGTALPRIKVAWSAPSEEFIQSGGTVGIEYKDKTATTYLTWSTVPGDQVLDYISSDVRIGTGYDVRIFGQSYFQISTSYVTASVTVAKDATAPSAPTSLTASVGTGKAVSLDWADNTEPDLSEYGIYRNTTGVTPASAAADKIAEVRASRFVDTEVTIGTTYYYWVNAYDMLENVSGFSNRATAVPTYVSGGSVDPTAPGTPSAPTLSSTTIYLASDGTAFARATVTAPGLTTNAIAIDVIYRKQGSADFILGNQINSAVSYLVAIDDLSLGVTYEIAARAISSFGVASANSGSLLVTSSTTAPAPADPTGGAISSTGVIPKNNPTRLTYPFFYFGTLVSWNKNTEADFDHYEIKATFFDTDIDTTYTWSVIGNGTGAPDKIYEEKCCLYNGTNAAGYIRIRAVNRSGAASAWVRIGNANSAATVGVGDAASKNTGTAANTVAAGDDSRITGAAQKSSNLSDLTNAGTARTNLGLGTLATQNSTAAQVTGLDVGNGSSNTTLQVIYSDTETKTFTGGSATEVFTFSLTNRGFSVTPNVGLVQCYDPLYVVAYEYDSSSASNAQCTIRAVDGSNIPAATARFFFFFASTA
jgi:hypothetical protein